jgi:hypothetical protein
MASKLITISLRPEIVDHLVKVKNRSGLIGRLLCAHFRLNPDTLQPIKSTQPMRHFISTNTDDDGYGN